MSTINKAAEEGELPALPEMKQIAVANEWTKVRAIGYDEEAMRAYARQAIAADRASRPVANKVEVDLSNLRTFYGVQTEERFRECFNGAYVLKADVEALLATPPATTGASTVLTDERIEEVALMLAFELDEAMLDANDYVTVNRAKLSKIAKNVLSSVAAQAGQVAVPDDVRNAALEEAAAICDELHDNWKWDDEPDSNSGPRSCAKGIRALAAPSPAKESLEPDFVRNAALDEAADLAAGCAKRATPYGISVAIRQLKKESK